MYVLVMLLTVVHGTCWRRFEKPSAKNDRLYHETGKRIARKELNEKIRLVTWMKDHGW